MNEILKLRELLIEELDYKMGIVDSRNLIHKFNILYDRKHSNETLSFEEKTSLKFYTFNRYLKRYYLKGQNESS